VIADRRNRNASAYLIVNTRSLYNFSRMERARARNRTRSRSPKKERSRSRGRDRSNDRPANARLADKRVYVSNIPYDMRWQDLKDLFRNEGNSRNLKLESEFIDIGTAFKYSGPRT
jgi:RNA recognition motif-containing protein